MFKYEVVGYEHRAGISKRTNKPYDIDVVHVIDCLPLAQTENSYGRKVEQIIFNRLVVGELTEKPQIGDTIQVWYNRSGFAEDLEII
jgi:hypothetical protein